MSYFVCRLNPPRATFAQDMTNEERLLMTTHVGYWADLIRQRIAVVFGPVGDPAGAWGLVVVEASDLADVASHTAKDPVILSGSGFSYTVWPMLRAVVRE